MKAIYNAVFDEICVESEYIPSYISVHKPDQRNRETFSARVWKYVPEASVNDKVEEQQNENVALKKENGELHALVEYLIEPYRLGAVTGEGVSKRWCRETYDTAVYKLGEI